MTDLATLAISGPIARLSLNRPDARNALSLELLAALHEKVDALATPGEAVVLVLTGEGKSFCSGMDLKAVLAPSPPPKGEAAREPLPEGGVKDGLALLSSLAELTIKLRCLPLLTVARVNGAAIGGGCGLACVCDFALTHADSKMGFPEVDMGVCPAVVAPWVVRKIGAGRARQILLMGGLMSGQEAFERGLVNQVVPAAADLDAAVDQLAQRLARGGPHALRATKGLLNELDGSLDGAMVRRGAELSADVLAMPEAQERLRARIG